MKFIFTQHALQQIFKRGIRLDRVKRTILEGEIIAEYPEDKPYPSKLSLQYENDLAIHVVYAINEAEKEFIVITAYVPSSELWNDNFKTRKE